MRLRKGSLRLAFAPALLAWAFAACGGLDKGEITIIVAGSGAGGDDSTPSGGKSSTSAGESSGGTESMPVGGADPGVAGAAEAGNGGTVGEGGGGAGGSAGEPPVVIVDDPPAVVSISPDNLATSVEPGTTVTIEFTESVDPATLDGAIVVKDGARVVPTTISVSGVDVVLTFDARLDLLTTYSVSVSSKVKDLAGVALKDAFSSTFQVRDGKWGRLLRISNPTGTISTQPYPSPVWDAQGNGLVVWAQAGSTTALEIWARFYHPTKGWQASTKVSTATTGCSNPSVAMNSAGDAIVAWSQAEAPNSRVYARRYLKGAWEAKPLRVDTFDFTSPQKVVTAMSETGEAHVLWRYTSTYDYIHARHVTGAAAWPTTGDSYITGGYDNTAGPTLSFGADGAGFMAWSLVSGSAASVRVGRYLPGTGWTNMETIAGSTTVIVNEDAPPTIAIDAKGGAMAAWIRTGDVATSRFTKAGGWTAVTPADAGAGTVSSWAPRLANTGDDFMVFWHQAVGNIRNAFANRYTGTAWAAQPALLSNGNTSVHEWSDTGFGLDRHGNGVAVWAQGTDVRSARYLASSKQWQADTLVEKLDTTQNPVIESLAGVSPNGMAAAMYAIGYPYHQTHNAIYGAVFE